MCAGLHMVVSGIKPFKSAAGSVPGHDAVYVTVQMEERAKPVQDEVLLKCHLSMKHITDLVSRLCIITLKA